MRIKQHCLNLVLLTAILLSSLVVNSQDFVEKATVKGNIFSEASYYLTDTTIGAERVKEYVRANIFGNIIYSYKNISAGMRYEAFQPPLLGYDSRYEGMGIANRYLTYTDSLFEFTIGNFYEQFGSGLVFRTYEDNKLGIDNSMDGFRAKIMPLRGLAVKTFVGKQRFYWDSGPGSVRGIDVEWNILSLFNPESFNMLSFGGSAVSRYQPDKDPIYRLPENVAAFAGRVTFSNSNIYINSEYAFKVNDPTSTNNLVYKNGQALVLSASYSGKGIGVLVTGKWVDNIDFRSSRNASGNDLTLSYIPATSQQQTYSLAGMYPYATQPLGEASIMAQVNFRIPKNSLLGGRYGTNVQFTGSVANSINKQKLNDTIAIGTQGTLGYKTSFLSIGNEKYFHDYSLEISRKINSNLKTVFGMANQFYNVEILQGHPGEESVKAWAFYADFSYSFLQSQNIRVEIQHLSTKQDMGNWGMLLMEYTLAPNWTFSLSDQYNYSKKHYFIGNATYNYKAHRVSISFGKQRAGVVCVGGVCRLVPPSYGASLILSTTF